MTRTLLLAAVVLPLAACVGTLEPVDPGGGGDDSGDDTTGGVARSMFDSDVSPMLGTMCAGCHVGAAGTAPLKFLGTGAAAGYYDAITSQLGVVGNWVPANAQLLNQGVHDGGSAPAFSQTQKDTISMWLLAEADERP